MIDQLRQSKHIVATYYSTVATYGNLVVTYNSSTDISSIMGTTGRQVTPVIRLLLLLK